MRACCWRWPAPKEISAPDPLRLFREFAERCQSDRRHVEQVRYLALQLFDQLGGELGCEPEERLLLEAAGLLHDVGQLVSYRKHHKHSYQLITHAERLGLPPRERMLVALISRYHRRTGPRRKHAEFAALPAADQAVVRRLSGLLRVADGLDRGHTAAVETVDDRAHAGRVDGPDRSAPRGRGPRARMLGRLAQGGRAGQAARAGRRDRRRGAGGGARARRIMCVMTLVIRAARILPRCDPQ